MNKLITKAKSYVGTGKYSKKSNTTAEDAGLALAYVLGQITGAQLRYAKDGKVDSSATDGWVKRAIVTGIRQGWLQVK